MKIKQAIELLKNMDQEAELMHLWDGECRTNIEHIYMGNLVRSKLQEMLAHGYL